MTCLGITGKGEETCQLKVVEWKIDDFLSLSTDLGKCYKNDYFHFANKEWCLRIYAGGETKESQEYISLFLQTEDPFYSECNIKCMFGFKKANGCLKIILPELNYTFKEGNSAFGYRKFFLRSRLLKRKSDLLPSGVLTVVCTLREGGQLKVTSQSHIVELRGIKKLSKDFQSFLADKTSCDVTLEVKGKTFEAHKTVLMARSPVFSAMFKHKMSEKETGTVVIPDCDDQSFGLFLEYIYSGIANNVSFCTALRLYPTAHKYDTHELKSVCLQYMAKNLAVEYVIDAVILADQYDEAELMSAVQEFFNANMNKIFAMEKWQNFLKDNYRLANKLLLAMSSEFMVRDKTIESDKK